MLKKCRIFFGIALFVAEIFCFSSCDNDNPVKDRQIAVKKLYKNGKVKIAVANSFEENKTQMWEAAVLALDEINKSGICPVEIELIKVDDGGTRRKGSLKAYEIASDKEVCAVIGHGYSDITIDCSLIYQYYGILLFNYISTLHELTEKNNALLFSNMPDDDDFGRDAAILCNRKNFKNVIIYYLENVSGTSLSNNFELNCNRFGISVANRDSYSSSSSPQEFQRTIKKWKNNFLFDAVFLAGRMPAIQTIIQTIRKSGITCPIIGADTFDDPLLEENLDESEKDMIFAVSNFNTKSEHPQFQEFYDLFVKKYGVEPDQEALQVYDALFVLARAIAEADSAVPDDIAEVLRKNEWNEAAGPYSFNRGGGIVNRRLTTKVFNGSIFEEIKRN